MTNIITNLVFFKGYQNKEDINDDNRLLIGNFRYDNNSKSTLQFFDAQVNLL